MLIIVFSHIIDDIGDLIAYIVCPSTTQELPEKHHKPGLSQQLPVYCMHCHRSIMDKLNTVLIAREFAFDSKLQKRYFLQIYAMANVA